MTTTAIDNNRDLYDTMLMEYAAGALDQALSLLMASHVTLSHDARKQMALCESLGGALIDECCDSVEMNEDSLASVLSQLDGCAAEAACMLEDIRTSCGLTLPQPLQRHMVAHACHTKKWRKAHGAHVMVLPVGTPPLPVPRQAVIARVGASVPLPRFAGDGGREYILVLEGRLIDPVGGVHRPGDLLIIEAGITVRPRGAEEGCACMVVADGAPPPVRMNILAFFRR